MQSHEGQEQSLQGAYSLAGNEDKLRGIHAVPKLCKVMHVYTERVRHNFQLSIKVTLTPQSRATDLKFIPAPLSLPIEGSRDKGLFPTVGDKVFSHL